MCVGNETRISFQCLFGFFLIKKREKERKILCHFCKCVFDFVNENRLNFYGDMFWFFFL